METKPTDQLTYDEGEAIRLGKDLVTVINFHLTKMNCMHCRKMATMALELHERNELYRYKNKMWKKDNEE